MPLRVAYLSKSPCARAYRSCQLGPRSLAACACQGSSDTKKPTGLLAPAPVGKSLIHGDYQHFNLLWTRRRLSGVIDWTWAGLGHPDRDVGHCRLNLAALFSLDWDHEFSAAYRAESGRPTDPWWDLFELCFYGDDWPRFIPVQVGGRATVDTVGMTDRVEELVAAAVE